VGTGGRKVAVGANATGCCGMGVAVAGAHAATSTTSRLRVVMRRVFISISFREFISGNPYERINTNVPKGWVAPSDIPITLRDVYNACDVRHFDSCEILRYT